jgi:hypothetical protein
MCGREAASGRMEKSALWAPVPKQKVSVVEREGPGWTVSLDSQGDADCPICGTRSSSRHGSYIRSLQDLPAQGTPVLIQARVTRWRCLNDQCERRTFAERRLDLTAPFARRTTRMAGIVRLFGHAAGGRPSERLLARLGMPVGHTTILRHVKRGARGGSATLRVARSGKVSSRIHFATVRQLRPISRTIAARLSPPACSVLRQANLSWSAARRPAAREADAPSPPAVHSAG